MALVSENMEEKTMENTMGNPQIQGKTLGNHGFSHGMPLHVVMKMMGPECFLGKVSTCSAGGSLNATHPPRSCLHRCRQTEGWTGSALRMIIERQPGTVEKWQWRSDRSNLISKNA
jgi:hypothetical protein